MEKLVSEILIEVQFIILLFFFFTLLEMYCGHSARELILLNITLNNNYQFLECN